MRRFAPISALRNLSPFSHPSGELAVLTRKEFYTLTAECRQLANELARHDQHRVSLQHCHTFNAWLVRLRRYDLLQKPLRGLRPARPVARWQVLVLVALLGLIAMLVLLPRLGRVAGSIATYGYIFTLILLYFVPEGFYGTTVEMLEGKILRVVNALEELLLTGTLGFTEAAFFKAKENLDDAKRELRQQIDLAHRNVT